MAQGRLRYRQGASLLALGRVTRVNRPLQAVACRPTREGTVQVELARQGFTILPTLAWYAELVTKPLLLPGKSAFVQNADRSKELF